MAEVILIHVPIILNRRGEHWLDTLADESSNYPMGLLYIGGYLEQHDIEVKVLDVTPAQLTLEDVLDEIEREKPIVVGLSSTTSGLRSAVTLSKVIRKEFKIPVGLGGAHINTEPDFFNRVPEFDFAVCGEGEKTFYDIVIKIKKGEMVKGLINGEAIDNLDDIPHPARHLIDFDKYRMPESRVGDRKPHATMLGSRGCPFECSFCCIPAIGHKVRYRTAKSIVDEMEAIHDSCGGNYNFVDDVLTLNQKQVMGICDEIINRGQEGYYNWYGMTRAEILKEELISKLYPAGCRQMCFGIESGSERVRTQVIGKKITNDDIKRAVDLCHKYGIQAYFFLMVGFPTETMEDIQATINIGKETGADIVGIHMTIPYPGTAIYEDAIKTGRIAPDLLDRFATGDAFGDKAAFHEMWPKYIPDGLTLEDLQDAKRSTYRTHYLRPSWALSRVRLWMKSSYQFWTDLEQLKLAPAAFLKGRTVNSTS